MKGKRRLSEAECKWLHGSLFLHMEAKGARLTAAVGLQKVLNQGRRAAAAAVSPVPAQTFEDVFMQPGRS